VPPGLAGDVPMKSSLLVRYLAVFLGACGGLCVSAPTAMAGERVKVTLVTILATTRDEPVDKRLLCIAREVQKKEPYLKGFKLLNMNCKSLAPAQRWKVKLVDNQEAVVVIHHGADKENRVELKVAAPLQGEIVYGTVCGKFLPIITRYTTRDRQDRLIIAVMVRPCHKK
jgi:hypothetical protein